MTKLDDYARALQRTRAVHSGDRDLRWIARENLRKRRLERLDEAWVSTLRARLD